MTRWLLMCMALTGCGELVQGAPDAGEVVSLPPIEWRVVERAQLEAVYRNSGQPLHEGDRLSGFAGYRDGRAVVYTLPPRTVDDAVTCTLGHEVMHIAIGAYHR